MRDTAGMKLVFRIGACGFSLPVKDLVEIRENSPGLLDRSGAVPDELLLGDLFHRGETIGVRDLGGRLRIAEAGRESGRAILVLAGEGRPWGVLVDRVEGLFPESEFIAMPLPPLFALGDPLPYGELDRWRGELLVPCEAQRLEAVW